MTGAGEGTAGKGGRKHPEWEDEQPRPLYNAFHVIHCNIRTFGGIPCRPVEVHIQ